MGWNKHVRQIQKEANVFYLCKDPLNKVVRKVSGSLFRRLPIQSYSTHPKLCDTLGFMDDVLVLFLGAKLLYRITPPDVSRNAVSLRRRPP